MTPRAPLLFAAEDAFISVDWSNGNTSWFSDAWLREHRYDECQSPRLFPDLTPRVSAHVSPSAAPPQRWPQSVAVPPTMSHTLFDDVVRSDEALLDLLETLVRCVASALSTGFDE
jgi:hypothetical protein